MDRSDIGGRVVRFIADGLTGGVGAVVDLIDPVSDCGL
jgi:hypothetical protein